MEYKYNIINDVYNWMISRKNNVEVRLLKEKSEKIQIGDYITFNNINYSGKFVKVKIINKTIFNNVEELLLKYDVERIMPGHNTNELIKLINDIYGDELKNKKIVAFEFEYMLCDKDAK